jgi:hypothetical protein
MGCWFGFSWVRSRAASVRPRAPWTRPDRLDLRVPTGALIVIPACSPYQAVSASLSEATWEGAEVLTRGDHDAGYTTFGACARRGADAGEADPTWSASVAGPRAWSRTVS